MEIYKIYESLLVEVEIESCVKKFGHELFGHELGGTEHNTGTENQYVRDINDFTDNKFGEETTPAFISALKTLKGCMKQYPEVLMPEKTNVYRGTVVPLKYFVDKKQPISSSNPVPYLYKANSQIQSWSTTFDEAARFGNNEMINEIADEIDLKEYSTPESRQKLIQELIAKDLRIAFVLEYATNPQEFIFKSKYFRMLSMAYNEDELIRIDNKPIQVKAKYNDTKSDFKSAKNTIILMKYINAGIQGI